MHNNMKTRHRTRNNLSMAGFVLASHTRSLAGLGGGIACIRTQYMYPVCMPEKEQKMNKHTNMTKIK